MSKINRINLPAKSTTAFTAIAPSQPLGCPKVNCSTVTGTWGEPQDAAVGLFTTAVVLAGALGNRVVVAVASGDTPEAITKLCTDDLGITEEIANGKVYAARGEAIRH